MEVKPLTVSQIISSIKHSLETQFQDITAVGEVSNLSLSSAGHYYFNLSDQQSSISCALFKMDAFRNPSIRKIKNGDKVLIRGPISVYARRGTFQVICKRVLPYGVGNLLAQYEMLKKKLRGEGLFDEDKKCSLPLVVKRIGIITALRGAALQDFLQVMQRRGYWFHITIIPSIVQGDMCAPSIIKAIEKAEQLGNLDTLVITRGGGSMEDLWGFNDENLVRKVYECSLPIISAIGHQVDYTLLDLVADIRCETPSTAAELLTQSQLELGQRLHLGGKDLKSLFLELKNTTFRRIDKVNPVKVLHLLTKSIHRKQVLLNELRFFAAPDILGINQNYLYLDELCRDLQLNLNEIVGQNSQKLAIFHNSLSSLNPKNVLGRGYTYLQAEDGKLVSTSKEFDKLKANEKLITHFVDGERLVQKVE